MRELSLNEMNFVSGALSAHVDLGGPVSSQTTKILGSATVTYFGWAQTAAFIAKGGATLASVSTPLGVVTCIAAGWVGTPLAVRALDWLAHTVDSVIEPAPAAAA